jgi:hypothetical protein
MMLKRTKKLDAAQQKTERASLSHRHGEPLQLFLIREAGPELLAAIEQVLQCQATEKEPCPCDRMMRTAVAKARGES